MQEFIDSLNLPILGEMRGKQYIIPVNSSNEFSKVFTCISMNNKLNVEDDSEATVDQSEFRFTDGYYEVYLNADYDKDTYTALIEEK